jgi:LPXTG-motif cell wall-anchored protein
MPQERADTPASEEQSTVPVEPEANDAATASSLETAPTQSTSPEPANAPTTETSMRTMPRWLIGVGAALLALLAGLFFWRRRKSAQDGNAELAEAPIAKTASEDTEPQTAGPEVADKAPAATAVNSAAKAPPLAAAPAETSSDTAAPNLDLKLEIEQLSRSMMMMSLKCRVTIANRSDKAARDITVSADMVSANRALPMEAQTAGETASLPSIGSHERIGPHKTFSTAATLTLPIQQLAAFKQAGKPLCVPLVRVRLDAKGAEPMFRTFVVGIAANPSLTASTKLQPVPLDGIPGSYPNVRQRPLDIAPKSEAPAKAPQF